MELSYWESRWNKNKTGFHMPEGYPGLQKHWASLKLGRQPQVLVPLCGKSIDLITLEKIGADVIGVEISEKAILSLFDEHQRSYETESYAGFKIFRSGNINLWQGDFLKFPKQAVPGVDLIYDKAALVALPPNKRKAYANKLISLSCPETKILLHHFIYPQEEMPGPPFSVNTSEIEEYFSGKFTITLLEEDQIPSKRFKPFQRRGLKSPLIERLVFLQRA